MTRYIYAAFFNLMAPVVDLEAAQRYLTAEDMTQHLGFADEQDIEEIRWELEYPDSGRIIAIAGRQQSQAELERLSSWIAGQNSDGLGEGFEQQDFAFYPDEDANCYYDGEDEFFEEEEYVMASFDWRTNDYSLVLLGTEE